MKLKYKVISLLVAISVCFSFTGCFAFNLFGNQTFKPGKYDFNTLSYERPDFQPVYDLIEAFGNDIDSLSFVEVYKQYIKLNEKVTSIQGQYSLINIESSLNVNDKSLSDESVFMTSEYSNMQLKLVGLFKRIYDSKHSQKFFASWTDEEVQEMLDMYNSMDQEVVDINKKIEQLTTEYFELYTSISEDENSYNRVGEIYLELMELYTKQAKKFGFDDYKSYAYKIVFGREYSCDDVAPLYQVAKDEAVEFFDELYEELIGNQNTQGIFVPLNKSIMDYEDLYKTHFSEMGGSMGSSFDYMKKYNLYNFGNDENRGPNSYTTFIYDYNMPYMAIYTNEFFSDISTFMHEFGHYYCYYVNGDITADFDLFEIHSQANTLLFSKNYEAFFTNQSVAKLAQVYDLYQMFYSILSGCMMDEFQQKTFGKGMTIEEMDAVYEQLVKEYGLEETGHDWREIPHNFQSPFYYISYAISAVPSLEIFSNSFSNRSDAINCYQDLIDLGSSLSFGKTLDRVGLNDPFDKQTLISVISVLKKEFI